MSAAETMSETEEKAWDALAEVLDRLPTGALELIASGQFDVRAWAARELSSGRRRAGACPPETFRGAELLTVAPRAD